MEIENYKSAEKCETTKDEVIKLLTSTNIDSNNSNIDIKNILTLCLTDELSSFFQECSLSSVSSKKYAEVLISTHLIDLNGLKDINTIDDNLRSLLQKIGMKHRDISSVITLINNSKLPDNENDNDQKFQEIEKEQEDDNNELVVVEADDDENNEVAVEEENENENDDV